MKRTVRQLLRSIVGGILTTILLFIGWLIIAASTDYYAPNYAWAANALLWPLAWPLEIFQPLFPAALEALSPNTPTPAAVLAALALDIIVYSLLAHAIYLWVTTLKRRSNQHGK
jgi:hypothetical protein